MMVKEELNNIPAKKSGLYFAGGGLVCPECREVKQAIGEEIERCGLKEISDLQILLKGDWRLIANLVLENTEVLELHRLVAAFAAYHTERRLPDWTVFERYGIVTPSMIPQRLTESL